MDQLKRLRVEKGLSQAKLAARAEVDPSTVNQIERGAREASPATLRKLAEALDVSLVDLLEEANVPKAGSRSSLEPSFNDVLDEERLRQSVEAVRKRYRDMRDHLDPYLTHWEQRLVEDDLNRQAVEEFLLAAKAFIPILMTEATQYELNDIARALGYEERGVEVLAGLSIDSLVMPGVLARYCHIGERLTKAWSERHASDDELAEIIDFEAELRMLDRRLAS